MKRLGFAATILCLASIAAAAAQDATKKAIQAQYDRWSRAYMANDVDVLLSILSPEYTLTNIDKDVMPYGVYKAYLDLKKKGPKDTTKYKTEIKKLTVRAGSADVDSVETMITEKLESPHVILIAVHRHEYLDKWRMLANVWRLTSTVTLKESTVVKHKT